MKKGIVLFLGAGASAAFGYPVTSQIFKIIRERLSRRTIFSDDVEGQDAGLTGGRDYIAAFPSRLDSRSVSELMDMLESRLKILLPGLEMTGDQLPSITEILSLIDYSLGSGDVLSPRFLPRYLEDLRELLERAIMEVLRAPSDTDLADRNKQRLDRLAEWILSVGETLENPVTVISMNYDFVLESAIFSHLRSRVKKEELTDQEFERKQARIIQDSVDFGFPWRALDGRVQHPPSKPWVRIYKLHGALNWLRCQLCGYTYINTQGVVYREAFRRQLDWSNTCDCLQGPLRSVIVAPSMVRQIRDTNLLSIWQSSLEALRTAEQWSIIGYSLPGEDLAIRSILMRAERAHQGPLSVSVYQRNPDLKPRFQLLFPELSYETGGMEQFIDSLPV